jgi:hypothetical protein
MIEIIVKEIYFLTELLMMGAFGDTQVVFPQGRRMEDLLYTRGN